MVRCSRAIERVKGVHHTTVINWVKDVGEVLPDSYQPETIPKVGELDELQTFVASKSGQTPRRRKSHLVAHQDKQNMVMDSSRSFGNQEF